MLPLVDFPEVQDENRPVWIPCERTGGRSALEIKLCITHLEPALDDIHLSELVLSRERGGPPVDRADRATPGARWWARLAEPLPEPPTGPPSSSPTSPMPGPTSPLPAPMSEY